MPDQNIPATYLHRFLVRLAYFALWSFFRDVRIIDEHNLPRHGAVIVASTHHNSALDPTVLSTSYPSNRWFHYWAKSGLFSNAVLRWLMLNAGNIPVDRGNKDKRKLFQGTFDVLEQGDAVAVFPEGTSYTEPSIVQVKDGAAWCALEYTAMVRDAKAQGSTKSFSPVVIVPASVVYTNKSKYRSAVILRFGKALTMDAYMDAYTSPSEGAGRAATKHLTHALQRAMIEMSVNAPDWETLNAARMAREILWVDDKTIPLEDFTAISQTLVDLFTPPHPNPRTEAVKSSLLTYYALLKESRLTHEVLSSLPLPRSLDPRLPTPLPSRLRTLSLLIRDSVASFVRLPFFLLPLLVHLPIYAVGAYVQHLIPDEEEIAQGKAFLGLFILVGTYSCMFVVLWTLLWLTPIGAVVAALVTWAFALYHVQLVDQNYDSMKRLVAAWRVLIGVWGPQSWEISLSSLQLSARPDKPENQYLRKKPTPAGTGTATPATSSSPGTSVSPVAGEPPAPPKPFKKRQKLPSRRLVRHVLRYRVLACQALFKFLNDLERSDERVTASPHLARAFGHLPETSVSVQESTNEEFVPEPNESRSGHEVIRFLRSRGAGWEMVTRGEDWGVVTESEENQDEGDKSA
ncbi:glycerol-3-phosphate acyltransferase [Dacryopinax primogenitus]|uniref:Glycerol-3-phosphate acyltransferase n=1 Tax=Dacryopinax primogenitus (strain DJM 731) TaxID=1858805 RepID=M5G2I3_DACPD|nr:glycerol-3-phosphate acyltransferase [Dacryopinax primogenitus]EJU02899.1 glycerol-3-phosphate acyltransferase [Dacryopinax primogenitus]